MDEDKLQDQLNAIANIASVANAVASLVVGHRKILVEGGFDVNLSDAMAANLHASLLGLVNVWEEDEDDFEIVAYPNHDDDDE